MKYFLAQLCKANPSLYTHPETCLLSTPFSYCLESILENMTIFILMQFLKPPLPVNAVNFSHVYSFSQTRSVLIGTSFHSLNDLRNSESVS